jgi:predicted 2-oxoglutarate/Fe(II)-dependent dioxygenase YbiX
MNKQLEKNNYIYLPNFLKENEYKTLAKDFENYCIENNLTGDMQAPNSSSCYNYVSFLELLCEKTPIISEIIGEKVLPTYTYARVYRKGDDLKRHSDRDACEVSLTVNLYQEEDWPIYIEKSDGKVSELILKPGDAMLYLGCVADHWRFELKNNKHIQVFLHYVKSRGERFFAHFDKERERPPRVLPQLKEVQLETNYSKDIENYIILLENAVPEDLCDSILKEYKKEHWYDTLVGDGGGVVDKNIRSARTINMSLPEEIAKNEKIRLELDKRMFECANRVIEHYKSKFPDSVIVEDSGYQLLKYEKGEFYKQHTDHFKTHPRTVSCSFALNDNYEGGEFAFFDRKKVVKMKKGSAILFPSNFMYPHEIIPVTKGTRYSIITWFV